MGSADSQMCSFCGLVMSGGVAGPAQDVYICRDCIALVADAVGVQGAEGKPEPDVPSDEDS